MLTLLSLCWRYLRKKQSPCCNTFVLSSIYTLRRLKEPCRGVGKTIERILESCKIQRNKSFVHVRSDFLWTLRSRWCRVPGAMACFGVLQLPANYNRVERVLSLLFFSLLDCSTRFITLVILYHTCMKTDYCDRRVCPIRKEQAKVMSKVILFPELKN